MCLRDTTARSCIRRLDEDRIGELRLHPRDIICHILKLLPDNTDIVRLTDTDGAKRCLRDDLCIKLVHRHRRRQNTTADVRDTAQLKESLNRSVLPIFSMKSWKNHIHLPEGHPPFLICDQERLQLPVRKQNRVNLRIVPASILDRFQRIRQQPFPFFRDASQDHIVLLRIDVPDNIDNRLTGNLMFR